jgi:hypothetical protein
MVSEGKSTEALAASKHKSGNNDNADEDEEDEDRDHGEGDSEDPSKGLPPLPEASSSPGVLPRVIKTLVDRRKYVVF